MQLKPREIRIYEKENGSVPFMEWMEGLEGQEIYGIIMTRLERVEDGNLGNCHGVGDGVSELVINFGPGYRVYFGQDDHIIVLLSGGTNKDAESRYRNGQALLEKLQCLKGRVITIRGVSKS